MKQNYRPGLSSYDNLNYLHKNSNLTTSKWLNDYSVYTLSNDVAKTSFLSYLKNKYEIVMTSGNKYFKFMDNDDIANNLKCIDHVVFFNTNPKYVLFIHLKLKNNKKLFIYVVKNSSEIHIVNYSMDEDDTHEFIMEGEIVNNNTYLVSDLLVHNEKKNNDDMHVKKRKITEILEKIKNNGGPCIRLKDYVPMENVVSFVRDFLPNIDYKNTVNGLVFRPVSGLKNKNIIMILNKPFHNLKLTKQQQVNVITNTKLNIKKEILQCCFYGLKTSKGPDVIDLYLTNKRDELIKYGIAYVPNIKNSIMVQEIFSNKNQCLLDCLFDDELNAFIIKEESKLLKASLVENITI